MGIRTEILVLVVIINLGGCFTSIYYVTPGNNTAYSNEVTRSEKNLEHRSGFWKSLIQSFTLIFFSEMFDKTFILVLFFALKVNKFTLFVVAVFALTFMNFISVLIGYSFPILLYKHFIDWIACIGFLLFGLSMLNDSMTLFEDEYIKIIDEENSDSNRVNEPASTLKIDYVPKAVNEDINIRLLKKQSSFEMEEKNRFSFTWSLLSSFILAECGDRSQISTIMIAAVYNLYGVFIGTTLSHMLNVMIAIFIGDRLRNYISEKQVCIIGCGIFFLFAIEILLFKLKII